MFFAIAEVLAVVLSRVLSDDLAASALLGDRGRAHLHHPIYTIS
jgi:hypothetical protein